MQGCGNILTGGLGKGCLFLQPCLLHPPSIPAYLSDYPFFHSSHFGYSKLYLHDFTAFACFAVFADKAFYHLQSLFWEGGFRVFQGFLEIHSSQCRASAIPLPAPSPPMPGLKFSRFQFPIQPHLRNIFHCYSAQAQRRICAPPFLPTPFGPDDPPYIPEFLTSAKHCQKHPVINICAAG